MAEHTRKGGRVMGPTGVVGFSADARLTEMERRAMRDDAAHILADASDPEALFERLVFAANSLRGWERVDRECSLSGRKVDLHKAIAAVFRGDRSKLTVVNMMDLGVLRRRFPDAPELELLRVLLEQHLPRPGKGRAPAYAMRWMGVEVAEACRDYLPRSPSSAKEGDYVALLGLVAHAATGKGYKDLHTLAEQCLRIEVIRHPGGTREFSVLYGTRPAAGFSDAATAADIGAFILKRRAGARPASATGAASSATALSRSGFAGGRLPSRLSSHCGGAAAGRADTGKRHRIFSAAPAVTR